MDRTCHIELNELHTGRQGAAPAAGRRQLLGGCRGGGDRGVGEGGGAYCNAGGDGGGSGDGSGEGDVPTTIPCGGIPHFDDRGCK